MSRTAIIPHSANRAARGFTAGGGCGMMEADFWKGERPMSDTKSGSRTLLLSVLMSAPGPLVVGLGLLAGRSSTQAADFVRRSAELLAIVMSYIVYRITARPDCPAARKAALEQKSNRFVGAMMLLGGAGMALLALGSGSADKGNVIPGLSIALMGVVANCLFWRKYTRLHRAAPNAILQVQARLYRAKTLVDGCVTAALIAVLVMPGSPAARWLDLIGSLIVAGYLAWTGLRTLREA